MLGCALIVAVLHAYFRDVAPILAAALLPWFFLTPIFFSPGDDRVRRSTTPRGDAARVGQSGGAVHRDAARVLYDGHAPDWGRLVYVALAAALALARWARAVFRRMEGELAVVV